MFEGQRERGAIVVFVMVMVDAMMRNVKAFLFGPPVGRFSAGWRLVTCFIAAEGWRVWGC